MREKLIKILREPIFPHELADPTEVVADYLLDNDVVPVVRCKDCKNLGYTFENDTYCKCPCGLSDPEENDFCSLGERKDNENT